MQSCLIAKSFQVIRLPLQIVKRAPVLQIVVTANTQGGAHTCTVSVQLQIDRKLEICLCLLLKHEKLLVHIEGCCNWRMRRLLLSCDGADGCLG